MKSRVLFWTGAIMIIISTLVLTFPGDEVKINCYDYHNHVMEGANCTAHLSNLPIYVQVIFMLLIFIGGLLIINSIRLTLL